MSGMNWRDEVWDRYLIEDTVWKHATLWSDHPHDLNYLGSLYGSFNRHKHLSESDPILYSGLDATVLLEVDRALERELGADPASRRVWETIDRPALRSFVTAQYRGLRTDPSRIRDVVSLLQGETDEASLKAQAIAGWPINVGSPSQVAHRLYAIEGLRPKR
jgi:DNA polymerase I-like protein with 3'-5' exonuclease and polymerase domains